MLLSQPTEVAVGDELVSMTTKWDRPPCRVEAIISRALHAQRIAS